MLSKFFIERPIFANVIAIVTMIIGGVAIWALPSEQFPQVTPPTISVSAVYPGASAQVVADTVAAPIEREVNGVENMLYMQSTSASNGSYQLTVTFDIGTDLDLAQVLVQNRVAIAQAKLPEEVRAQGIVTKKKMSVPLLVIILESPDSTLNSLALTNYAYLSVKDELARLKGVGDIDVSGAGEYSMRVWLDPEKLKARSLTTEDVLSAIREQNVQVAAGQIGAPPAPTGQNFQLTINTLGRLDDVEQFADIIVKSGGDGRLTRIRDIGRVELGGQTYDTFVAKDGKPAAALIVFQLPGANALAVAEEIKDKMQTLKKRFPQGMDYSIPFDTTVFVEESINEVYKTLFEAGVLVLIVILVFLQDWRAVLIPATTVPVTIIGAFAAMAALGFSINMLTLFGLVLAIGIVVDDAIVIVENVVHHLDHEKLDPKTATIKAMDEILGPVIGITVVLLAVFLPTAFQQGITGQMYRQFALTIAATALISAINAVTLKPVQCAAYLKPTPPKKNIFARGFNSVYDVVERVYTAIVSLCVRVTPVMLLLFAGLAYGTYYLFNQLPTSFLPIEDQGFVIAAVQLPDSASQQRTKAVTDRVDKILSETPGVASYTLIGGNSILDGTIASNAATYYIVFEPWHHRKTPQTSMFGILGHLRNEFSQIQEAVVFAFPPPAILGLGVAGGFELRLQDRGGAGFDELGAVAQELIQDGNAQSGLRALNSTFRPGVPQLYADVDRVKVKTLDVPLSSVFATLQGYLGAAYVNDFNKYGRTYQVRVQADHPYRQAISDVKRLDVRNRNGDMVPLGTVVDVRESLGPHIVTRYNLYPSASIQGEAAPGYSSGQALQLVEQMADSKLPSSMGYEWTGISYQEKKVGNEAGLIFGLAVLFVYLSLAAQYESWTSPAAVILVVPLGLLGSGLALLLLGMPNNVYTQIGLVLIIALASKNAILIVEFARELRHKGRSIREAAIEASRLRFRPILMTSFAFILGVYPLVNATGAGAASRRSLGTAVFGGMITSTVLAVFFVPVFYVVMQSLSEWWKPLKPAEASHSAHAATTPAAAPGEQHA